MPPNQHRAPIRRTSRRFSTAHVPLPVYLGIDIEIKDDRTSYYALSVHDGMYCTDFYEGELRKHEESKTAKEALIEAFTKLHNVVELYAMAQNYKVQLVACSYDVAKGFFEGGEEIIDLEECSTMSDYWRELDALPFRVHTHGQSPDERASAAVRKAVMWLSPNYPGNLPRISVGFRHEVEVDFNHIIHMVKQVDYQDTVCKETWDVFQNMTTAFNKKKLKVSFFNSTPQGGGVALMRHALLRFLHLSGIEAHWYVARPKPEVFDITKRKFHNVLQGVAAPDVWLSEKDKQTFIDWSDENVNRFWLDNEGPIKNSDVIVIDDPQVSGIIPHIRKHAPNAKIIFRSHIEIRSDTIKNEPEGSVANTWNFLWGFIKQADLFVAHPIKGFIPDVVPTRNTVLLPAATDPLDGLNKSMTDWCLSYYQSVFNRVCVDLGVNEVDWYRPYIAQVARFDPSKGIPDVLESYRLLREKMKGHFEDARLPQLVICGHGSVDDPDGSVIFEQVQSIIESPPFSIIASDIIAVRLPASDQLLNMILRGAHVALQLSHREGFEVKVTEALHKGVPVVAYRAGGIPLQINGDDGGGFLVPVGDCHAVADVLFRLFKEPELRANMSANAKKNVTEEYFTVWNSIAWLHMCLELTQNKREPHHKGGLSDMNTLDGTNLGNQRKVSELWRERYNYPIKE